MKEPVIILKCDRCGREEFIEPHDSIGDFTVRVGGKTLSGNLPEGWRSIGYLDLCPKCAKEFDKFMKGGNEPLVIEP